MSDFAREFDAVQREVHSIALGHGWWDDPRSPTEALALVVCEVAEAIEGLRAGDPPSEHIPEYSAAEEECADAVIRLMDLCERKGWRLAEAIEAKCRYNSGRPYKHGKLF